MVENNFLHICLMFFYENNLNSSRKKRKLQRNSQQTFFHAKPHTSKDMGKKILKTEFHLKSSVTGHNSVTQEKIMFGQRDLTIIFFIWFFPIF